MMHISNKHTLCIYAILYSYSFVIVILVCYQNLLLLKLTRIEVEISLFPVHWVVVYPDRAEVTREIKVTLDVGEQEVQIKNISKALVAIIKTALIPNLST